MIIKERKLPSGEKWYTVLAPQVVLRAIDVLSPANPKREDLIDLLDMIVNSPNVGYGNIAHLPGIWHSETEIK